MEISVADEDALANKVATMQLWLARQRFEPLTFRYSFVASAILFRVDFSSEAEALAFATAFDGKIGAH